MFKKIIKYFINQAVRCQKENKQLLDISEPVLSMVNTLSEKGRWKFKAEFDVWSTRAFRGARYKWILFDKKTEEKFEFFSSGYRFFTPSRKAMIIIPTDTLQPYLPFWLTGDEVEYLKNLFKIHLKNLEDRLEQVSAMSEKKKEGIIERNRSIERDRLIKIYK
jgi:hypothetical protein